jgi:hypothetical protein
VSIYDIASISLDAKETFTCLNMQREYGVVKKTTDLPLVTDKFDHTMLYRVHLAMSGIRTDNISGNRH